MKLFLFIYLLFIGSFARTYTSFKQCNTSWKNDVLGTSTHTICSAGSLITSVSMMINTYGVKVNSQTTNPHTLNIWLSGNGGYVSGDLFVYQSISVLGFVYQGKVTAKQAKQKEYFDYDQHVILQVKSGNHYVLMTGHSTDTFHVHDPGYSQTSYPDSEVVMAQVYTYNSMLYYKNHVLNLQ